MAPSGALHTDSAGHADVLLGAHRGEAVTAYDKLALGGRCRVDARDAAGAIRLEVPIGRLRRR